MTQPVQEASQGRVNQGLEFRTRQLFRRPASPAPAAQFDIKVAGDSDQVVVGDGQFIFAIPSDLNNLSLSEAQAYVTTVATGGTLVTVQIRNVTAAVDMLSTPVTIDASEFTSYTAAVPSVVDGSNSGVWTADLIAVDVDAVGNTTPGQGLGVILTFG